MWFLQNPFKKSIIYYYKIYLEKLSIRDNYAFKQQLIFCLINCSKGIYFSACLYKINCTYGEKRFTKAIILMRNVNENYRSRKSLSPNRKCSLFFAMAGNKFYIEILTNRTTSLRNDAGCVMMFEYALLFPPLIVIYMAAKAQNFR